MHARWSSRLSRYDQSTMSLDGIGQTAQVLTLWWWGQNIIQVICIIIYEVHRASLCHVLGVQQVQHTIYGPVVRDLQHTSAIKTLWLRVNFQGVPCDMVM